MDPNLYRKGFIASSMAFAAVVLFVIVQTLQVFQVLHFPWDEILIFSASLLITIPFLVATLAVHYTVSTSKKFSSHGALLFSLIYLIFVTANYIVQLAVVIPAKLRGQEDSVRTLAQVPYSVFWYFDAVGYIALGIAAFFLYLALNNDGIQKYTRLLFLLHSLTTPAIAGYTSLQTFPTVHCFWPYLGR